jgi:hypothetical protein
LAKMMTRMVPPKKNAPSSGASVEIKVVFLRWHYPDQVPRVGAGVHRGRWQDTLSAWLPKLPFKVWFYKCTYVVEIILQSGYSSKVLTPLARALQG